MVPWLLIYSFISSSLAAEVPDGIHLPLYRRETREIRRRDANKASIGLGDDADFSYNVLVKIGSAMMPVVLDTGSSDLWVTSDACRDCITDLPLYPHSTFQSTGINAALLYGDSHTGTHAYGQIGTDSVSVAGLSSRKQYFAAITDTNTSVLATGSTGIFGLGFPINSVVWSDTFNAQHNGSGSSGLTKRDASPPYPSVSSLYPGSRTRSTNYRRPRFPQISSLYPSESQLNSRQSIPPGDWTEVILASYDQSGPLLSRLAEDSTIAAPMYSITLQRDSIDIGGNVGMLSVGSLPNGVQNSSMTWVPLRAYSKAEGGLSPPTNSPNEKYPLTWEVFVDDVYLDGQKLPRSQLASPNIALSALVDTGNSLIRGPSDLVNTILTKIGADSQGVFPCATPHTLAFSIGGKMFPVDPRDFVSQAYNDETKDCTANLAVTDTPIEGQGYLYSWSFGDPFLKSVVTSYYLGNITYPSHDPPKMGFLSTVPSDANSLYQSVVQEASANGFNYPWTSVPAPTGAPTVKATDSNGVAVVGPSTVSDTGTPFATGSSKGSGAAKFSLPTIWVTVAAAVGGMGMFW